MVKKCKFQCEICTKEYSSIQSLCNHTTRKHGVTTTNKSTKCQHFMLTSMLTCQHKTENNENIDPEITPENTTENKYKCDFCSNTYKYRQSKSRHQLTCDKKTDFESMQNKIIELENKIINLSKVKKSKKLVNSNNNNSNNVNNGVINNITIKFGAEDLSKILTKKDMIKICNKKYASLEESIQMVHFNKDKPELHNVIIKNLKDDIAFIHDGEDYIAKDKNDVISDLIELHLENIEMILDEENENNIRNKIDEKTIKKLEDLRDRLDDENQFKINEKTYDSYRAYKINQIKLLIYNCIKKLKIIMNK